MHRRQQQAMPDADVQPIAGPDLPDLTVPTFWREPLLAPRPTPHTQLDRQRPTWSAAARYAVKVTGPSKTIAWACTGLAVSYSVDVSRPYTCSHCICTAPLQGTTSSSSRLIGTKSPPSVQGEWCQSVLTARDSGLPVSCCGRGQRTEQHGTPPC